jgi:ketosteroid isomerase-like protein
MNFDALAAANDWLDAYRSADLEQILACFSDNATLECSCGRPERVTGKSALELYWKRRLAAVPAHALEAIWPIPCGAKITYATSGISITARVIFGPDGLLTSLKCRPANT